MHLPEVYPKRLAMGRDRILKINNSKSKGCKMNKTTLKVPEHSRENVAEIVNDCYSLNEFEMSRLRNNSFLAIIDSGFINKFKKLYSPTCEEL
jgi:hypothetical protein